MKMHHLGLLALVVLVTVAFFGFVGPPLTNSAAFSHFDGFGPALCQATESPPMIGGFNESFRLPNTPTDNAMYGRGAPMLFRHTTPGIATLYVHATTVRNVAVLGVAATDSELVVASIDLSNGHLIAISSA